MSKSPKISIVIPCYNREEYIRESINSALSQTYEEKEIIVVDDGSTDSSWAIIQSFGDSIIAIKSENGGVSIARNRGLALASGHYIVLLDSDDRLEPGCLVSYAASLPTQRNYCLLGKCRTIDSNGDAIETEKYKFPGGINGRPMTGLQVISTLPYNVACLLSKELIMRAGGYNCKLSLGEDYDLNVRLVDAGAVFLPLNEYTYQCRVHAGGGRLTTSRSRERYGCLVDLFRRTWNAHKAEFMLPENRLFRVRFACWIWSMGREAYRAQMKESGDRFVELAAEIAGPDARSASNTVRFLYRFLSPYSAEMVSEWMKRRRSGLIIGPATKQSYGGREASSK